MDWQQLVAATGVVGGVLGAIMGAAGKAWVDNKHQDHVANIDQLQLALSQIREQNVKIDMMGGQIYHLNERIELLLISNTKLQCQLISLGAVPMDSPVEARVSTLERRSAANSDRIDTATARSADNAAAIASNTAHIQTIESKP